MDNGGGNGAGCFEVEIWADTAKFTNVIVAGFRKCRDLVEKVRCSSKIKPRLRAELLTYLLQSCRVTGERVRLRLGVQFSRQL